MALVSALTKDHMLAIEAASIVNGEIVGDDLILTTHGGTDINAGDVRGPIGPAGVPTGALTPFAGSAAPTGYLLADGAAVSRTTYSDLFDVIGTTYGAGNGTTTFNVPDLKGRVAVGLDAAQGEFDTLGEQNGAKTHTLSASQIPEHSHLLTFDHAVQLLQEQAIHNFAGYTVDIVDNVGGQREGFADALVTAGGDPHNNLQPYTTLNYIIKT